MWLYILVLPHLVAQRLGIVTNWINSVDVVEGPDVTKNGLIFCLNSSKRLISSLSFSGDFIRACFRIVDAQQLLGTEFATYGNYMYIILFFTCCYM